MQVDVISKCWYPSLMVEGQVRMRTHNAQPHDFLGQSLARCNTDARGEDGVCKSGQVCVRVIDVHVHPSPSVD